jgi:long-chain acyl-CoA synthetase
VPSVWHITERTFELWISSRGCSIIYSSVRTFKKDLAIHKPEWLVLVPRVLEKIATGVQDKFSESKSKQSVAKLFTSIGSNLAYHRKVTNGWVVGEKPPGFVQKCQSQLALSVLSPLNAVGNKLVWSKVQAGFGGHLKTIICGGSALSGGLESFYEAAGITISVGYGLTECSPLLTFRRTDSNLVTAGCAGQPCFNTEIRIVDPEAKPIPGKERAALPPGAAGVILGRGPQVMKGYYKNPEATAKAIDEFGWFDTGDLGRINPATGDLILTGRAKDTIVLSNGENIEPVPIEDAIFGSSSLIDQIMLTGQDGRGLVAILVLNPNELANGGYMDRREADILQTASEAINDPKCSKTDCETNGARLREASAKVRKNPELNAEITKLLRDATNDFRKWEKVGNFYLTLEPFAMANGLLTQSYKVKRDQVSQRYMDELSR